MSIYKNISNDDKNPKYNNLGVKSKDNQSIIDYLAGFNGDTVSFSASEYDAVKGFFENKGFDKDASESIAYIILKQSRTDNVPVFQIIDKFSNTNILEINEIIAEIINLNRFKSSVLGFKSDRNSNHIVQRNIKV